MSERVDHPPLGFCCETVKPGDFYWPWPMPCINCGKPLRHWYGHHWAEAFCSEPCEEIIRARRAARAERRSRRREGIACICCGLVFQPKRRGDAQTCSRACRQKLYRQRVTDRAMVLMEPCADV